jgi:hypothetical protein
LPQINIGGHFQFVGLCDGADDFDVGVELVGILEVVIVSKSYTNSEAWLDRRTGVSLISTCPPSLVSTMASVALFW